MIAAGLVLASDHAGFALKQSLVEQLRSANIKFEDLGPDSEKSVDYPDFAAKVGDAIVSGKARLGVLICGTGQGMAMSANKIPGVRAALAFEPYSAKMARQHNNAQILCMGARVIGTGLAWETLQAFLNAEFEGGRHQNRVDKITALEKRPAK